MSRPSQYNIEQGEKQKINTNMHYQYSEQAFALREHHEKRKHTRGLNLHTARRGFSLAAEERNKDYRRGTLSHFPGRTASRLTIPRRRGPTAEERVLRLTTEARIKTYSEESIKTYYTAEERTNTSCCIAEDEEGFRLTAEERK